MMHRRSCLSVPLLALFGVTLASKAEQAATTRPIKVGLLVAGFESNYAEVERALLAGFREAGYVEGKNLLLERRYGHLQPSQISQSAQELAGLGLDAIVTGCTGTTRAAQRATATIPIVMASVADPVGQGFVSSLARPGHNVTGRSSQSRVLIPKMLELFVAAAPSAKTIAVLANTLNPVHEPLWRDVLAAAQTVPVKLVRLDVDGPADLAHALAGIAGTHADALFVLPDDPMFLNLRSRIVDAANALAMPSFFSASDFVEAGGLLSYGERFADTYGYAAPFVDKLARGAKAAELPIEQPTQFELVINLRTAAALGLTIPRSLLLRANTTLK